MISPMTDLVRAVLGHVDRQELIDLAGALIRIPSFKTEETPVALFLEAFFRRRGYDVDLQEIEPGRFQTIATLRGTGGGASLMLNGHTDINALTRRWKRDPWTPSLEGDRLYGHGVQNMKGGLASIIMTAEAVRRSGVRLARVSSAQCRRHPRWPRPGLRAGRATVRAGPLHDPGRRPLRPGTNRRRDRRRHPPCARPARRARSGPALRDRDPAARRLQGTATPRDGSVRSADRRADREGGGEELSRRDRSGAEAHRHCAATLVQRRRHMPSLEGRAPR